MTQDFILIGHADEQTLDDFVEKLSKIVSEQNESLQIPMFRALLRFTEHATSDQVNILLQNADKPFSNQIKYILLSNLDQKEKAHKLALALHRSFWDPLKEERLGFSLIQEQRGGARQENLHRQAINFVATLHTNVENMRLILGSDLEQADAAEESLKVNFEQSRKNKSSRDKSAHDVLKEIQRAILPALYRLVEQETGCTKKEISYEAMALKKRWGLHNYSKPDDVFKEASPVLSPIKPSEWMAALGGIQHGKFDIASDEPILLPPPEAF